MKKSIITFGFLLSVNLIFAQLFWSNPSTWGGIKPVAGQNVTIPLGQTIILDESTPNLAGLTIEGTLEFARQNLNLSADYIIVMGKLQIGAENNLFTQKATITLTGSDTSQNIMGHMGTRGIVVMGGQLELYGASPKIKYSQLNANANAGTSTLILKETTNWNTNDQIVIAPTDFYRAGNGVSETELRTIVHASGTTLHINSGLAAFHWGSLQYATNAGMSLVNSNIVTPPVANTNTTITPVVLDERATVANLTRNIVIQAPNDALWTNQNFGFHIMIMGNEASAKIDGVEMRRGGQMGRLRRYPIHWHMLSYSGTETLSDATGQYIQNSTLNSSANRGIVIHGTNGLLIKNNILYNITGHGIFTENAVERRNTIDSNVVLMVRNPPQQFALKRHEFAAPGGSSGFWISNPDNILTNNIAADCQTFGFWLAYPQRPFGESANVLHTDGQIINPSRLLFGVFDNNTAHSNRTRGIMLDEPEVDEAGNFLPFQYQSTTDGRPITWPFTTLRRFALSRYKVWKNGSSGIWDRGALADNFEVVSADNSGRFFAGSGSDGVIERSLVIGTSLNHLMNGTDRPLFTEVSGNQTPAAFATYHSAFDIKNNIVINFPAVENTRSGAFATEDYYIRPVDKGQVRSVGNLLINSHPGVKIQAEFPYFKLAGALWDPNNIWGGTGTNNYFVYNSPFFTHGQTPKIVPPGNISGGVITEGPYYGVNDFILNRANLSYQDLMAINVSRVDANGNEVGVWSIEQAGDFSWLLSHMRHFAAHKNGQYILTFPTIDTVSDIAFQIENMLTTEDTVIFAVEYSGAYDVGQVYISSFTDYMGTNHANWPTSYLNKHVYAAVANKNAVVNSTGRTYWHDKCNNLVWVKIQGGIQMLWNDGDHSEFSDERLYREFHFRIYGTPNQQALDSLNCGLVTSVNEIENPNFSIYPNPSSNTFTIKSALKEDYYTEVFDVFGKLLFTATNKIDLSSYQAGVYNAIITVNNKRYSNKLVKME